MWNELLHSTSSSYTHTSISWWKLPSHSIEDGLHRINVQTIIISAIPNQFSHQTTLDYLETWLFEYTLYSHDFMTCSISVVSAVRNCVALKFSLSICLHFSRSTKLFTQDSFFIEWLTIFLLLWAHRCEHKLCAKAIGKFLQLNKIARLH